MEGNKKAVPEIRFKGFEEEWEVIQFADLFQMIKNNTFSRDELDYDDGDYYNIHYGDILIKFTEVLNGISKNIPHIKNKAFNPPKSSLLKNGDVVIADTAEDETVGKCVEINNLQNRKLVAGLHTIPCRPNQEFGGGYLGNYMNSPSYHTQLTKLMQGTKVLSISKTALERETKLRYPSGKNEQNNIAEIFSSLESIITQTKNKYDSLQHLKETMLEKMFPKDGADVPEIRFKGFSGAWENKEFSTIVTRVSILSDDVNLPRVEYEDIVPNYGVLNKNIYTKNSLKRGFYFKCGDILFGKLRPYLKNWLLPDFDGIAVGDFWIFRTNDNNNQFIYSLIQSVSFQHISNISAGSKMPRSDWSLISSSSFLIPNDICEQKMIGNYFRELDNTIIKYKEKLKQLSTLKKALLEKMFV